MSSTTEAPRSCADCPGCLTDTQVRATFSGNFGAGTDLCGTHGHVLSIPGSDAVNVSIKRNFAKICPTYGENRAPTAVPQARVAVVVDLPEHTETKLSNCTSCKHFIPAEVVKQEFGWDAPMCGAQGRLLLAHRLRVEPQECGSASSGIPRTSTMGVIMTRVYDPPIVLGVSDVATAITDGSFVEPLEYVSDRPLTADDKAHGIRAWRKLVHPRYGELKKPVWLPIFDPSAFTEAERAMIPKTDDDEHPELYNDHQNLVYQAAVAMVGLDKAPVLTGEAGCGKTEMFRHLAWLCQMPFLRISVTKFTEPDDIIGGTMFEANETIWYDGRLTNGYRRPWVIVIDEWNTAQDALLQTFRPMTDNSKQLVRESAKGKDVIRQEVSRHDWCLLGFTQNPSWDLKYVGTNQLSNADEERCLWVAVDLPSEEVERSILVNACIANGYEIEAKTLDAIMAVAKDIRALTDPRRPTLSISWGLRPQIAVAQLTEYQSLMGAYKMVAIDRLEPTQGDIIRNFVLRFES